MRNRFSSTMNGVDMSERQDFRIKTKDHKNYCFNLKSDYYEKASFKNQRNGSVLSREFDVCRLWWK
jgi:hypothetical protein